MNKNQPVRKCLNLLLACLITVASNLLPACSQPQAVRQQDKSQEKSMLADPNGAAEIRPIRDEQDDELLYKYQGNMVSGKFHRPDCPYAQIMNRHKKVFIARRNEALERGFRPCRFCLPRVQKTVRARLLN